MKYAATTLLVIALLLSRAAQGEERLIKEEPYDQITIPDGKNTTTLKVFPIKFPQRRVPKDPKPTDKIRVRLLDDEEDRDFEVAWRDIKKLELYEDRVREEAEGFMAAGKLDEAFEDLTFLLRNYPRTQRLDETIQAYWYVSTGASYREKKYDEALATLEELLKKNPDYKHSDSSPSLVQVLGQICDKIVQRYLEDNDFRTASRLITRILRQYPQAKDEPFLTKFEQRLQEAAGAKRDEARAALAEKRYTEAYDATAAMLDILPSVPGGRELATEMASIYPLVVVGVDQLSVAPGANRIDRWADQRVGRLTDRRLMELRGVGPEGGEYVCPVGKCERSEDGRYLNLTMSERRFAEQSFSTLERMLAAARPESEQYLEPWAELLRGARLIKAGQIEATLARPHVLPQALLALPLSADSETGAKAWEGAYQVSSSDKARTRYVLVSEAHPGTRPREIQERVYSSPEAAILALGRGEIDLLDRIQPPDVDAVARLPGVSVQPYAVPVVHVLVPNANRPWPASRTFRRAIVHGLQREAVLREGILRGHASEGARLVSGPLPAPTTTNDPLAYAYDDAIPPHAYEPLLALTLIDVAKRELQSAANIKGEEPPKFKELVIGHDPVETQRIACKAFAKQLTKIGIPCRVQEVVDDAGRGECDFVYAELLIGEPVVDVPKLFGQVGLHPASNPHVRLGVRLVEQATTWNQAGQRLRQLHRILHEDLTVLPLWQTIEHYAVRSNVQGVRPGSVSLYQDVDSWRIAPRLGQE
jgi:tetratricopeptide (TPR) repeat protein